MIRLFYNLLVNERMLTYVSQLHVPLFIYIIILGEEEDDDDESEEKRGKERPFIVRREVERSLKFIYQYVKISRHYVPKIYGFLIKNLLV